MKQYNNQFATQKLRENFDQSQFNANKLWDFLQTKPFYNKDYMPMFNTAEEIWDQFGPEEKQMYADFQWDGDPAAIHRREAAALKRRQNYDSLAGEKFEENSVTGNFSTMTSGTGEQYATPKAFKKNKKERGTGKGIIYKDLWENLNENYYKFRNETKTKTNEQQFHTAIRLAEKKIREANRILEYTAQLKGELTEVKVNKNTEKLMERVTRGIAEAYGKMKKLK
jgi:hypothetical protein